MVGYRTDLPRVFAACDIFVHCPTYPDPFPTVIPEAMMMGKAAVGSRIGGIPEQVADGLTGLTVNPNDPIDLARALNRLLGDPGLRSRLAAAGQAEALSRYAPRTQAVAQVEYYTTMLRGTAL